MSDINNMGYGITNGTDIIMPKSDILICKKSNMEVIGVITTIYNLNTSFESNTYPQIEFDIPYKVIDKNGNKIDNPDMELLQGFIYLYFAGEYYLVDKNKDTKSDKITKHMSCTQIGAELAMNELTLFNPQNSDGVSIGLNLNEVLTLILTGTVPKATNIFDDTGWKVCEISTVSNGGNLIFLNESKISVVALLEKVAEFYKCVLEYNSIDRTINLYGNQNVDKGIYLDFDNGINEIDREVDETSIRTKLFVQGKDIGINKYNPTGQSYITNYDYFLNYNGNNGVSDDFKNAMNSYKTDIIDPHTTTFNGYIADLNVLETQLATLKQSLNDLQSQKQLIEDNLNSLLKDTITNVTQIATDNANISTKTTEITNKTTEVTNKQAEIDAKNLQITNLGASMDFYTYCVGKYGTAIADNISKEIQRYTYTEMWDTNDYDSQMVKELYDESVSRLNKLAYPKVTYTLKVIDFIRLARWNIEGVELKVGDLIWIYDKDLDIQIQAQITTIKRNYEDNSMDITISNSKTVDILIDLLHTAQTYQSRINDYGISLEMSKEGFDIANTLLNANYNTNEKMLIASTDNSVVSDHNGITVKDMSNGALLRLTGGIIALSPDGTTWHTAITGKGITADVVTTGKLNTTNVQVLSADKVLSIYGNSMTIQDCAESPVLRYKTGYLGKDINNIDNYGLLTFNKSSNEILRADNNGIIITGQNARFKSDGNSMRFERKDGLDWTPTIAFDGTTGESQFAGKITSSSFTGGSINIGDGQFTVDSDGKLVAQSGTIKGILKVQDLQTLDGTSMLDEMKSKIMPNYLQLKGLQIKNDSGNVTLSIDANGHLSINGEGNNNVSLDSVNGLVCVRTDKKFRTIMNATYGIVFQSSSDGFVTSKDVIWADTNGNLILQGNIRSGSISTGDISSGAKVTIGDYNGTNGSDKYTMNFFDSSGTSQAQMLYKEGADHALKLKSALNISLECGTGSTVYLGAYDGASYTGSASVSCMYCELKEVTIGTNAVIDSTKVDVIDSTSTVKTFDAYIKNLVSTSDEIVAKFA